VCASVRAVGRAYNAVGRPSLAGMVCSATQNDRDSSSQVPLVLYNAQILCISLSCGYHAVCYMYTGQIGLFQARA